MSTTKITELEARILVLEEIQMKLVISATESEEKWLDLFTTVTTLIGD